MDILNNTIENFNANITDDVTLIQDLEEIGLTELETVVIACLATAVPLLIIFGLGLLLKLCIDRCMKRKAERYQGYLTRDDSRLRETDDEMKTSESQFSVIPPEEINEVVGAYGFGGKPSRANGSIITINMKNNHLIVETEEPVAGIIKPPSIKSPFSYATSTSSRNTLVSNTSGGTTYMVDIVEEQDAELDDLLEMNGPFMSNQEYYKYNKSKYEAAKCSKSSSIHIADVNPPCVDLAVHNSESNTTDQSRNGKLRDFQSDLNEKKMEDVFKRSLSDSVDNEEVLSVEILDSKNEALNYQRMLNDNQMFLKDIKTMHNGHNIRLTQQTIPQSNSCDNRIMATCSCDLRHYEGVHSSHARYNVEACDDFPNDMKQVVRVPTSPGIYDYACNCKVPHTGPQDTLVEEHSLEMNIPDVIQHSHVSPMSSQCILENYQNIYNDIRLGQVTSGFSQCDSLSSENEYYRYGNQVEYYNPDAKSNYSGLPEDFVHLELQKKTRKWI